MLLIIIFSLITLQSHVTSEPINHLDQLDQKWAPFAQHQEVKRSVPIEEDFSVIRSKRDLTSVVQSLLKSILSPIKIIVDGVIDGITSSLTALYISSEPSNSLLAAIVKITNPIVLYALAAVINVRSLVDGLFDI